MSCFTPRNSNSLKAEKMVHGVFVAELVFETSIQKDAELWSSIIAGCSLHKQSAEKSISLFKRMQNEGVQPNYVTLLALLIACTNIPSITIGSGIHGYLIMSALDSDLSIENSLLNMSSKCGSLKDSDQVFEKCLYEIVFRGAHLSMHMVSMAPGEQALQLFNEMKGQGKQYDSITISCCFNLSACNHAGLVEEAHKLFSEFVKDYNLLMNFEHYACYIDLLGRAGKLESASEVLRTMPMKPSPRIMSSIVSACKIHGRLDVAVSWFIESEPDNAANYTLLSMIYAEFGKWLNVEGVQMGGSLVWVLVIIVSIF